ncbi:MAG TPA: hypothetical protein VKA86_15410 [Candidatus Krumholzibacteria bacterium]|nr:hypothetical protein [Candidatus Krumholzibacteria bacterium]
MDEPPVDSRHDPQRLEEGLQRLRELGYLQTPAESYVAARVGRAGSRRRSAAAAGVWIGGGGGLIISFLLTLSAVVSEPILLERPRSLLWLWLDMTAVLVVLAGLGTGAVAWGLLASSERGRGPTVARVERLLLWLPGLVASLYLADRLGRVALVDLSGPSWLLGTSAVAVLVGLVGALVSWSLSGALALARLQGRGVFRPVRLRAWERPLPFLVFAAAAASILTAGPYRGLDPIPRLGELEVRVSGPPTRMLVVAVDGVTGPVVWPGDDRPRPGVPRAQDGRQHPAGYWNELATGFPPSEHGLGSASAAGPRGFDQGIGGLTRDPVLALLVRHLLPGVGLGRTVAADRRDLRRPPVWEILAAAGRSVRVVNWWATYPAMVVPGLEVVSDRHFLRLHDGRGDGPGLVAPPDLLVEDARAWRTELEAARRRIEGYTRGRDWLDDHSASEPVRQAWDLATGADLYHVARAIEAGRGTDLVVVHLNGMDIVRRALERSDVEATASPGLRSAQEAYVHALLERLVDAWSGEVVTVLRGADDGRSVWARGPTAMPRRARAWAPWLLWSQGVVPPLDMELPSRLRGSPLPADRPETYGRTDPPRYPAGRSVDDLERLRSLGYIDG